MIRVACCQVSKEPSSRPKLPLVTSVHSSLSSRGNISPRNTAGSSSTHRAPGSAESSVQGSLDMHESKGGPSHASDEALAMALDTRVRSVSSKVDKLLRAIAVR